jgi:hypothetical protein
MAKHTIIHVVDIPVALAPIGLVARRLVWCAAMHLRLTFCDCSPKCFLVYHA